MPSHLFFFFGSVSLVSNVEKILSLETLLFHINAIEVHTYKLTMICAPTRVISPRTLSKVIFFLHIMLLAKNNYVRNRSNENNNKEVEYANAERWVDNTVAPKKKQCYNIFIILALRYAPFTDVHQCLCVYSRWAEWTSNENNS